jgi:hypothetical protein
MLDDAKPYHFLKQNKTALWREIFHSISQQLTRINPEKTAGIHLKNSGVKSIVIATEQPMNARRQGIQHSNTAGVLFLRRSLRRFASMAHKKSGWL